MKKSRIARSITAVESPTIRSLPLVELLVDTKTELFELMVRSGLRVLDAMLEEDRRPLGVIPSGSYAKPLSETQQYSECA